MMNKNITYNFVRALKSSTETGCIRWNHFRDFDMFNFPVKEREEFTNYYKDDNGNSELNNDRCFFCVFEKTIIIFLDVVRSIDTQDFQSSSHFFEILLGEEGENGYLTHMQYDDVIAAADENIQIEIASLCHYIEKYLDGPENRAFSFMEYFIEHSANW